MRKKAKQAQVCQKCHNKIGENNPNWTGASICPQCGEKKSSNSQVCWACYLKQDKFGESNPNWKGGINAISCNGRKSKNSRDLNSFEYATWRLQVFTRDNFICQHCQKKSNKLNAHHIQNFSTNEELQLKTDNGVTLCKYCHRLFHSLFGNKNNNSGQLNWFFENVKLNKGV